MYKNILSKIELKARLWALYIPRKNPEVYENIGIYVFDRLFSSPLGIAAGFDINGTTIKQLLKVGFSHVEVGTITPDPQKKHISNVGALDVYNNIGRSPYSGMIGLNISKNINMSFEMFSDRIAGMMELFNNRVDYYVIDIKNAPPNFLSAVVKARDKLIWNYHNAEKPILVKIPADIDYNGLEELLYTSLDQEVSGVVIDSSTKYDKNNILSFVRMVVKDTIPIISVGGISSSQDVLERMRFGASLVQLHTSFISQGPSLVSKINKELSEYVYKNNLRIADIVGEWA